MKKLHGLITAGLLLAIAGPAAAEALYASVRSACIIGPGGEGVMNVGSGRFSLGETNFMRQGDRKQLADGWTEASYAPLYEGEPGEPVTLRLRISDDVAEVIDTDGNSYRGERC